METPERVSDEALILRFRAGDEDAVVELYERYKQLVRSKTRSYFLVGADYEDIIQEGMIGLYKAICDFDPARETSFPAFADLCVRRQILTAIKMATRKKHGPLNSYVSLNRPRYDDDPRSDWSESVAAARVSDPEELLIDNEKCAFVSRALDDMLTPLERGVLEPYLQGFSYQQIAKKRGVGVKSVDNAIQRIKKKLTLRLDEYGRQ